MLSPLPLSQPADHSTHLHVARLQRRRVRHHSDAPAQHRTATLSSLAWRGPQALPAPSRHTCDLSTCACHAMPAPQRASFQRPACHVCVLCDCVLCVRPFALSETSVHFALMMMMLAKQNPASCHTKRAPHHARAPAFLTAPILTRYPWHQLVWRPPSCVPPLTCCPAPRVPAWHAGTQGDVTPCKGCPRHVTCGAHPPCHALSVQRPPMVPCLIPQLCLQSPACPLWPPSTGTHV